MKRLLAMLISLCVMSAAAETRADVRALGEKLVQLMEKAAVIVDASQNDCDAMGDRLDALITANQQLIAEGAALSPAERDAILARFQARINAAKMKLIPGIMKCKSHPKVTSALLKIP